MAGLEVACVGYFIERSTNRSVAYRLALGTGPCLLVGVGYARLHLAPLMHLALRYRVRRMRTGAPDPSQG